jgi:choline dehydrogenase
MWQLLPFSRGTVKVTVSLPPLLHSGSKHHMIQLRGSQSNDPYSKPQINVNYFSVDYDLSVQVAGARLSRKILGSPPLNSLSTGETIPGNAVPNNGDGGSDAAWRSWITQGFASVAHPIGTAAMMKRSLGG